MCGIAGKVNFSREIIRPEEFCEVRKKLRHRGPDGDGYKIFENCGLAHTRLSIIDIPGGTQPMSNEDASIWIVFNGEMYNFQEYRSFLLKRGHIFKSNSDTEVIIHLYEEFGLNFLSKINGMFAFAILDIKKKKLILARDRLGQKPLHYFKSNNVFAFASELAALRTFSEFPNTINFQAIHHYFSLQYVPCPMTAYEGVFKLPPAHYIELDIVSGNFNLSRYWNLDFSKKINLNEYEALSELYDILLDSVKLRLISDVPIGVFLSGGLDSSIITALMADLGVYPLKTFTVGFTEKLYDERFAARKISAKFATCHYEKMGNPDDFELLKNLIMKIGEPYSDSSILPTALISKFASEEVKVVLGGDGADELFCGYYRYLLMRYSSFADILPLSLRSLLSRAINSILPSVVNERSFAGKIFRLLKFFAEKSEKKYYRIIVRFDEELKKSIYGEKLLGNYLETDCFLSSFIDLLSSKNSVEKYSELDIQTYLNGDILTKLDIASMANSIELRSPFLDYRVAQFASSLPLNFKQKGRLRKYILKKAFEGILPDEIIYSKKKGFGVPVADWLRGKWKKHCEEYVLEGRIVKESYISREGFNRILKEHLEFKQDHSYAIFAILCFALWIENNTN
ncbi:MAG TPA: asparagine synthase (glutamine-hydrolyzing) [Victivallales bacterium]|nr:asparagine synthase (glutamine-hydrolyzing) [Victivallales bacterium]HPO89723.1 asparagine synthase (glutamine-hydrolyzing) [Victivallales bacterium]HRR06027.1 asparagine synthase (glutamine-hydrolyzing) [Victivallales bacterium]HRU00864.1 asparagine synthase (glutamine-hydrolyzing) [Victivallales bacterium]